MWLRDCSRKGHGDLLALHGSLRVCTDLWRTWSCSYIQRVVEKLTTTLRVLTTLFNGLHS